ncbi:Nif3-like dinuclear metal center hexameric protein [Klenkia sp. PcliD-1-E]|uniref:Nif3-like dinuclear metal center hexameric protein n=1 Tax=Klenkia sp. PcliD-1-E TaxID=2954492 RepID=UPI0020979B44|nr:Nif3-like dinuclear metal center hexameric protein [Klenkia sp. PcliD-1-E]MCO7219892.1 Nif3-like dinuclear metal center hexameric protein [Klenkia sp. PcliD-1-E]
MALPVDEGGYPDPLATVRSLPRAGAPLAEVVAALEARYDPALAEDWDAVGLVCGDPAEAVRSVLFAVDPTDAVVDEAIEAGVDLVVTHHPLLLTPVHGVPADDPKGRVVHRLIRAGIGLFVAHTNADRAADHGVNDALAAALGVGNTVPLESVGAPQTDTLVVFTPVEDSDRLVDALSAAGAGVIGDYTRCAWQTVGTGTFIPGDEANPAIGANGRLERVPETRLEMVVPRAAQADVLRALHEWHPYEDPGYAVFENSSTPSRAGLGRLGELAHPITLREFAERAAAVLPATAAGIRVAGDPERVIRTVAVCGGSGSSLYGTAASAGADVLLTSDVKHHPALDAMGSPGPAICEVAHFASEWPWLPVAADVLHRDLGGRVDVAVSRRRTDPWTLHVPQRTDDVPDPGVTRGVRPADERTTSTQG